MAGVARAECPEKEQLIERLRTAMDYIVALTKREMEAAIANDVDLMNTIGHRLENARKQKESLLLEYRRHIKIRIGKAQSENLIADRTS